MIDYKLILILVLSIVLLYVYNKVDSLKNDITELKKNHTEDLKKMEVLLLNNNKFFNNIVPVTTDMNLNCEDGFCKMPVNNKINTPENKEVFENVVEEPVVFSQENIVLSPQVKEKNTTDFSATENDSESESNMTSSENFVVYSNEKKEFKKNLVTKYTENLDIEDGHSLSELCKENDNDNNSDSDSNLTNELLNQTHEISNDFDVTINLQDNNNESIVLSDQNEQEIDVELLIDKLGAEPLVLENEYQLNGIELNKLPSSYLEIIESSNSNDEENIQKAYSESNVELVKVDSTSINSELDYELSENNVDELNETQIILSGQTQLDHFNTYKLYDLQQLAKENNLTTTKVKNGKIRNKTKKELYNELNKINLKNN
jgi:hypothetical protein